MCEPSATPGKRREIVVRMGMYQKHSPRETKIFVE
jgi:hypothetical protein